MGLRQGIVPPVTLSAKPFLSLQLSERLGRRSPLARRALLCKHRLRGRGRRGHTVHLSLAGARPCTSQGPLGSTFTCQGYEESRQGRQRPLCLLPALAPADAPALALHPTGDAGSF